MNRCSQRRTTVARDRGRPLGLATATELSTERQLPSQPPLSRASGERRSVHERRTRAQAQRARKFARAFWWGARTASANPPGVLFYGNTMTMTDAEMNRNDIPDVLLLPQFGLALKDFATPVPHGAPVNIGMMTVTGVDVDRDDNPDVSKQPHKTHDLSHGECARDDVTMC